MKDRYDAIEHDEDRNIASAVFEDARTLVGAHVTLRTPDLSPVHGLNNVSATGVFNGGSGIYAYFKFGPSRLGLSNATISYDMEFDASDVDGSVFTSIIGVKVNATAGN